MKNTLTRNQFGVWTLTQSKDNRTEVYHCFILSSLLDLIINPQF